jgi:PAS domain S-box-containing protein
MQKNNQKIYYLIIVISLCIAYVLFYFAYSYTQKSIQDSFVEQIKIEVRHLEGKINSFHDDREALLVMLSNHKDTKNFLLHVKEGEDKNLEKLFINQVKSSNYIFQLRILDLDGNELFRVNKNKDIVYTEKKENLQNKFLRNYFQQFLKLEENQIGFSDLDLNIENNQVEKPFIATLRMAIPVYITGKKEAIIIINYAMNDFLQQIRQSSYLDLYLIDKEGYFIIHPNPLFDWSRYKEEKINAETALDIDFTQILSMEDFYIHGQYVGKAMDFLGEDPKILIYKEKEGLGVNSFLEKSKFAGMLVLFGILMIVVPVFMMILATMYILKANNLQIQTSQKKLKSTLDNTFDSIIMIDQKGIITTLNKAALETFGYEEEELLGKNVNILIPNPHHDEHDNYIKNHDKNNMTSKIIGANRELFGLHKDGSQIAISLAVTKNILDGELFFIGTIRDISEQKKMQEKEKAQEHMLMQQSKLASMGEMVTAIAHQWRQPLNAIGLAIQDLVAAQRHGELDAAYVVEIKEDVTEQLTFMSDTIDEFRNFFKQSNEDIVFDLIDLLHDVSKLLWMQASSNSVVINLHVKIDGKTTQVDKYANLQTDTFKICSKPSELKQILINLVTNAKDAIVSHKNREDIKNEIIIEVAKEDDGIVLSVKDYAGGIEQKIIDRIFEPYFTTKEMGTGLGLYICQMLAQRYFKSSIKVESQELQEKEKVFKGTVFSLHLNS